jgi:aminoglycoside phosphotransferase family enzyme/predicted kinase
MSLIEALQNPALYDHPVDGFELIETHISWVLLTGEFVYKIKKPVDFGFLDFSTLDKRRFYCEEELRLNRRLAPQLYLEVVTIQGSDDAPVLNGQGEILEYAVKMRQFPQAGQLDRQLEMQGLDHSVIDKLAEKVARFHLSIPPIDKDSDYGDVEHVSHPVLENFEQVRASIQDEAMLVRLDKLEQWSKQQLTSLKNSIEERKAQGFIRECHGDMHLRNIAVWQDEIVIFDCIEFNQNLYQVDVMSDIAFLVMDLEDRQQPALAQRFLNRYLEITGDYAGLQLLLFYKVYRAMVRAKVDALRCAQETTGSEEYKQTLQEFEQYIELAEEYTCATSPVLMINMGLSGSGKSVGSRLLAEQFPAIMLRSDVERKRLFNVAVDAEVDKALEARLYSKEATTKTYNYLVALAQGLLRAGYSVIIDAANLKQWQRQLFIDLAANEKVPGLIMAYHADEAILKQRVIERAKRKDDVSDADLEVLEMQLTSHEPLTDDEQRIMISIDTERPIDVDRLINQLK